jgi:hypothetical protein
MTDVETTLYSLITSGSVACYPLEKPQTISTPVAVYKRLTTNRQRIQGVKSTFNKVRMSISVYGNTYSSVKSAVSTINGLLDENTNNFTLAVLLDQKDFKESETGLFHIYLEYFIFAHAN